MKNTNCYSCNSPMLVSDNYKQYAACNIICYECRIKQTNPEDMDIVDLGHGMKMACVKKVKEEEPA